MTTTLVLPGAIAADIVAAVSESTESAAVLLARRAVFGKDVRLLARSLHWVPESAYLERGPDQMRIASEGYVPALALAETDDAIPIWFHTHPGEGAVPLSSRYDREVDRGIAELFQLRSGSGCYATLIASPDGPSFAFSGELMPEKGRRSPIDRIAITGSQWRFLSNVKTAAKAPDAMFDRNIRAFGPAIQSILGDIRVVIVGAGGTGSAVAEQLVRLGIRRLLLVDNDELSMSNVTRVYGSTPKEVGRPKVDILRDHLQAIAPDLDCVAVRGMITTESVARRIAASDVIFGCTDDNAGRLVLSRMSTYLLLPIIDVGVLLSSDQVGTLTGIDGRITTLAPGAACLVCRDRIDMARAAAEMQTPDERRRLADEGYAPALGNVEPAVVAFTSAVAALAVNELLDRLIGYGPPERPTETLLRLHDRELSTNIAEPRAAHYCHPAEGKWGAGDTLPFLGQLWTAS